LIRDAAGNTGGVATPVRTLIKVALLAAGIAAGVVILGHHVEVSGASGTPAALETPGTSASSTPQTAPQTSTPPKSLPSPASPSSAATVPQTTSPPTTGSPPPTAPPLTAPARVTPQPVYTPPVVTQPYVPVATTAATAPTTSTTIAPIGNRLPAPAVTLPLITKGSNGHVDPLFAILSGAGFFLALVIMATTFVLTRPKRARTANR
jgi:hypothetical protein